MGLLELYCMKKVPEAAVWSHFFGSAQISIGRSTLGDVALRSLHFSSPCRKLTPTQPFLRLLIKHIPYYIHCFSCSQHVFQDLSVLFDYLLNHSICVSGGINGGTGHIPTFLGVSAGITYFDKIMYLHFPDLCLYLTCTRNFLFCFCTHVCQCNVPESSEICPFLYPAVFKQDITGQEI